MLIAGALMGSTAARPAQAQVADLPRVDVVVVGGGLSMYIGDLDANPDSDFLQFIGASNLHLLVGAMRSVGERRRLGLELSYDRVSGQNVGETVIAFTNNVLSLDLIGSYDFSVIEPGFFGVFAGVGPVLFLNPQYRNFPEDNDKFKELGTRLMLGLKAGIVIRHRIRIGFRFMPTDYLDGYEGVVRSEFPFDFVTFINLGYRFNFSE